MSDVFNPLMDAEEYKKIAQEWAETMVGEHEPEEFKKWSGPLWNAQISDRDAAKARAFLEYALQTPGMAIHQVAFQRHGMPVLPKGAVATDLLTTSPEYGDHIKSGGPVFVELCALQGAISLLVNASTASMLVSTGEDVGDGIHFKADPGHIVGTIHKKLMIMASMMIERACQSAMYDMTKHARRVQDDLGDQASPGSDSVN